MPASEMAINIARRAAWCPGCVKTQFRFIFRGIKTISDIKQIDCRAFWRVDFFALNFALRFYTACVESRSSRFPIAVVDLDERFVHLPLPLCAASISRK